MSAAMELFLWDLRTSRDKRGISIRATGSIVRAAKIQNSLFGTYIRVYSDEFA